MRANQFGNRCLLKDKVSQRHHNLQSTLQTMAMFAIGYFVYASCRIDSGHNFLHAQPLGWSRQFNPATDSSLRFYNPRLIESLQNL